MMMGNGRTIKQVLPSFFNYDRIPPASSDSLQQPLLDDDGCERIEQSRDEREERREADAGLEKEVSQIRTELSKLESQIAFLSDLYLHKAVKDGKEGSKEIKDMKSRVGKLELKIPPLQERQERNIDKIMSSNAAMEKKITELTARVSELDNLQRIPKAEEPNQITGLKSISSNLVIAKMSASSNFLQQMEIGGPPGEGFLISFLIFLIGFMIGINI